MESNTIIRVLLLLTLCTSNLQTRKVLNFHKDNDESFGEYDDEVERKTYKTWIQKLDESENIVEGMLDDLEEMRQLEDFNSVEEQKHDVPKEVSDTKPKQGATMDEVYRKLDSVKNMDDFYKIFHIKEEDKYALSKRMAPAPMAVQSSSGCGLIDTTYDTSFGHPNLDLYPNCITRKKCGGCCHPRKRCVASETETIQATVFKISSDFTGTPYLVTYENALKCECQCKKKEADCSGRQRVNPQCECHCPDDVKKLCPAKKQWSPSKCDCECSATDKSCSLGKQWNSNTCSCEKTNVIPTCDSGRSLNSTSCVCN